MRLVNYGTLVAPYELCACADVGDVPVNPIDVQDTLRRIEAEMTSLHQGGVTPLSIGGDHIISYPILRALGAERPVGMIHVDAHSDTGDTYFGGQKLTHGTPFRRAIEDGVLDPKRTVQIGIRGTMYASDERDWAWRSASSRSGSCTPCSSRYHSCDFERPYCRISRPVMFRPSTLTERLSEKL